MENVLFMDSRMLSPISAHARRVGSDTDLHGDDAAFFAITDFRREYPITVEPECRMEEALADMQRLGLHALLVTRQEQGGFEQQLLGLVTAYDIERVLRCRAREASMSGGRTDIAVGDLMTSWNELPLIKYESLQDLTVLELHEMFRGTGLTHVLVVETHHDDSALVRGLVSRASLAKRLRRYGRSGSR